MKKTAPFLIPALGLLLPMVAFAQLGQTTTFITVIGSLVNRVTVIVAGLALLVFFIGLVQFIINSRSGKEDAIKAGRTMMIWGIVSLFVMVSVWGIVYFLQGEIGIGSNAAPEVPTFFQQ